MPSNALQSIPVIDISSLPDPAARSAVAADISQATEDAGFFYVSGHGIDPDLIKSLRLAQRELFNRPIEEKATIAINQANRGYLGHGQAKMHGAKKHDQKEVFFWGAELAADHRDILDSTPLCGVNQWPKEPINFKNTVLSYATEIQRVGDQLLEAIALSLGAPYDFFRSRYQEPMLRGQLIRYPRTEGDSDNFGVAPHTDFGCITLLLQETAGLQVQINEEWVSAPPIEGTLVINIGDLLERWSNCRLPSTRHRVRNTEQDERYSIAMFHDPSPRATVDPTDLDASLKQKLTTGDAIADYEPVMAAEYILGRNKGAFSHYGKVGENRT